MRTRFFPADPPGDDDPGVDVVPERDPSREPPRDELAAVLPVSEVVGRGDDLVIAVAVANVYSDGVELQIERRVRRGGRDDRGWHETQMEFAGHWGPSSTSPDRLRWGVEFADGQRLYLDERFTPPRERHAEGHTLAQTGGGGSGGGDDYRITEGLWLWPLPPEGPLQIVVQWPAFGVRESRVTLDATRIRALAASVQPLWGWAAPRSRPVGRPLG